ncbi:hypothetical protein GJQ57_23160 [Ralstonia pickettii]|uniref:KfrA N-terminal DNA-binding domain-containing protein n=1 Tax=Ralstonia pickettii TaxID=329 RepID=A0A7X2HRW5_RALPI|nr:hypothetical protein [Ralstonia pickettii]
MTPRQLRTDAPQDLGAYTPVSSTWVETTRSSMGKKNVGGRPGITVDDVKNACEALRQQGRPIGPVNVRLELGRGSFTTIVRALRALGLTQTRGSKGKSSR